MVPPSAGEAAGQAHRQGRHTAHSHAETVGFSSGKGGKGQKHKLPSIDFFLNIRGGKIGRR